MRLSNPILAAAALLTALSAVATAQSKLREHFGAHPSDALGYRVAGLGDVNGDGKSDYAIGLPYDDTNATDAGAVQVFSGANGTLIRTLLGGGAGAQFGFAVANAGDVSGDGVADLIIGAPGAWSGAAYTGRAYVYSGSNGTLLHAWNGDANGDRFGHSVAGGLDSNQDGFSDVIVGAYGSDFAAQDAGMARVFSGSTGSVLASKYGLHAGDLFGWCVAVFGDATGDGLAEFAVSAILEDTASFVDAGVVRQYNGSTGGLLSTLYGSGVDANLGFALAGGADLNNDGAADLLVGEPGYAGAIGPNSGRVRVFGGGAAFQMFTHLGAPGDRLGSALTMLSDVNGDARADYAMGAPGDTFNDSGYVRVASGVGHATLYTLHGELPGEAFGYALASAGDVNADGRGDLLVGSPNSNATSGAYAGAARLFSGDQEAPKSYCVGKLNSANCVPFLSWSGAASVSSSAPFTLTANLVLNQRSGLMIYSTRAELNPFQGATLCVDLPVTRTALSSTGGAATGASCTGALSFDFNAWIDAQVDTRLTAGRTIYAQFWYRDGAASYGTGLSNAVSFAIAP